jgi:hypothetical protein
VVSTIPPVFPEARSALSSGGLGPGVYQIRAGRSPAAPRERATQRDYDERPTTSTTLFRATKDLKAWQEAMARGYEGIVAKDPESRYVPGRTLKWLKIKQKDYRVEERGFYDPGRRETIARINANRLRPIGGDDGPRRLRHWTPNPTCLHARRTR